MIINYKKAIAALGLALVLLSLGGCPCGFDCNDSRDSDNTQATLTLGFSDAPLEQLSEVVLEIGSITFVSTTGDDVLVSTFTIDELSLTDAESFQIDLLDYRGTNQLLVIENLELEAGSYKLQLEILDENVNLSHVEESDGTVHQLNSVDDNLVIPGLQLSTGSQAFTVDFELALSLTYSEDDESYDITAHGVRLVDNEGAGSIFGSVDSSLFDTVDECSSKEDPEADNRIYLYSGVGLAAENLVDVHTSESSVTIPEGAIGPFAVAALDTTLNGAWEYAFGFIPPGDYTLAFSCAAADDDSADYDAIIVPLPANQVYEIPVSNDEQFQCDLTDSGSCS